MKKYSFFLFFTFWGLQVMAQENNTQVDVIIANEFHITKPLTEIFKENPDSQNYAHPEFHNPNKKRKEPQLFPLAKENDPVYGNDKSIIQRVSSEIPSFPTRVNWVGQTFTNRPFDPTGAAGPNHYIQMVNATSFRIYNKTTGAILLNGTLGNLWNPAVISDGDPIVLYDKPADRWFLAQFGANSDNKIYIAVSQTANPLGAWYTYTFTSPQFPDYIKFSVWNDAYYMTSNQQIQKVFAFNRNEILAGTLSARSISINYSPPKQAGAFFCPLAGDASDGILPPEGIPCPILSFSDNGWGAGFSDAINIYNLSINWTPTTPIAAITLDTNLSTAAFNANYNPLYHDCVQPGTAQKLDGIGGILMYRAQWKKWTGYNSIVLNWGVEISSTQRGIMWCELRQTDSIWSIYQQGIFSPGTDTRWLGSIAMNEIGEIGMCYIRSNSTNMFPSIYYVGRRPCDPLNTLPIAETLVEAGTGFQGIPGVCSSCHRIGDYSQLVIDPSDGLTFWGTSEYMGGPSGINAARTRIFSFTLPHCIPSVSIALSSGSLSTCEGSPVSFIATPIHGGPSPTYQWKINGSNVGTNSNTFSSTTLQYGDIISCSMNSSLSYALPNQVTSNSIISYALKNPVVAPMASPAIVCNGATSQLEAGASSHQMKSVTTTVLGINPFQGNVFDIHANRNITIQGIKMNIEIGATEVQMYYKPGGYGNANVISAGGWISLGPAVQITPSGAGSLTTIPTYTLNIPQGQTYGFIIVCNGTSYSSSGSAPGNIYQSNSDLAITEGHAGSGFYGFFSFTNAAEVWNGEIIYDVDYGITDYNWLPHSSLSSDSIHNPIATPLSSNLYMVTVIDGNGCTASATLTVMVNTNPTIPIGAPTISPTNICRGDSITLQYPLLAPACDIQYGFENLFSPYSTTSLYYIGSLINGNVNTHTAPDSITIISSAFPLTYNYIPPYYSLYINCAGYLNFEWTFTTTDTNNEAIPMFAHNNSWDFLNVNLMPGFNMLSTGTQSGTASIQVYPGQYISLGLYGQDFDSSSRLIIKNLNGPYLKHYYLNWYDAEVGGNMIGSSGYDIFNVPVNPRYKPDTNGSLTFYAELINPYTGCISNRMASNQLHVNALPNLAVNAYPSTLCFGDSTQLISLAGSIETDSIKTTLQNNNFDFGNVFDITASKSIVINGIKANLGITATTAEVWYKNGGYGNSNLLGSTGWTQLGTTVNFISAGEGNLTDIPITTSLPIAAGETYGIAIVTNGLAYFTNGSSSGNIIKSNSDISIKEGHAGSGMFGLFDFDISNSIWNGEINYEVNNGIESYSWLPTINSASDTIPNPKSAPLIPTVYTLTIVDGNSCSKSATQNIYVKPLPILGTAIAYASSICAGDSITLSYNQGATGMQCTGAYQFNFAGNYSPSNWTLTTAGAGGNVYTNIAPSTIYISSYTQSGEGEVNYSITVPCDGIVSFDWVYNTLSNAQVSQPRYSINGSNFYLFNGFDSLGDYFQTGKFDAYVAAGQTLTLQAFSKDIFSSGCDIALSNFKGPIQNIVLQMATWFLDSVGGTSIGFGNTINYVDTSSGPKSYYAQVSNGFAGCIHPNRVASNMIIVDTLPQVQVISSIDTVCEGESVAFLANHATFYYWEPGNLVGDFQIVSPTSTTTYTITGISAAGCSKTTTYTIVVRTKPLINASANIGTICAGDSTDLTGNGGLTYTWMPGALNGSVVAVAPLSTTTFTVIGTDANGCSNTNTVSILVNPIPTISISATSDTICAGSTTILTASGASYYEWYPSGDVGTTININPINTTTYTLVGTDAASGCTNSTPLLIVVNPLPNVTSSATFLNICSGSSTTLFANGATNYVWQPGAFFGNQIVVSPPITTTYIVTGTDMNGCTKTASVIIQVTPGGTSSSISVIAYNSYTWAENGLTYTASGTYTYSFANASGCIETSTLYLTIKHLLIQIDQEISCYGANDGSCLAIGTLPIIFTSFTLDNTLTNSTGFFQNISSGVHTICASDGIISECSTFTLMEPQELTVNLNISNPLSCLNNDGEIIATIQGGTQPYSDKFWSTANNSAFAFSQDTISNLSQGTYTFTVIDDHGCIVEEDITLDLPGIGCNSILNLTCFIEGYWNGNSLMTSVLANQGEVTTANACDSIIVELHDINTPYTMLYQTKTVLQQNGSATCLFQSAVGSFYVVVRHRNAIETWSSEPVSIGMVPATYNFSDSSSKAFGDNQKLLNTGVFGFYSGDIIKDGNVDLLDLSAMEIAIDGFEFGYRNEDLNGDGNVDLLDLPLLYSNINQFIFSNKP